VTWPGAGSGTVQKVAGRLGRKWLWTAAAAGVLAQALTTTAYAQTAAADAAGGVGAAAQLEIVGRVDRPLVLTRTQLLALPRREYVETRNLAQDGQNTTLTQRYQGLALRELLERAGLAPDRREIRRAIVLVTARDGYQVSFSWGELFNSRLGDGVILVLRQGDDELLDSDGLPGLRSLQDLRPGPRHVRWVQRIEVQLPSHL
jgi:DMSO/TMAO reductase YedYZ molybdopterin-dependent catalytic subunit